MSVLFIYTFASLPYLSTTRVKPQVIIALTLPEFSHYVPSKEREKF